MFKSKISVLALIASIAFGQTGCIKEYNDPSNLLVDQVSSSIDGLIGVCNGMQGRYSVGRQSPLYQAFNVSGLVTNELKVFNLGNTDEVNLNAGAISVTADNSALGQLWAQSFLIIREANLIIDNIKVVPADATTKGVVQAYGHVYKALAIGTLATFFEQMPVTIGSNQPFVTREVALKECVTLLEQAETVLASAGTIPASLTSRLTTSTGFDLKNTIVALQARYNLMLKDYTKALAAANKVSLTVKSAFRFDAVNVNPIFFVSYSNSNVVGPIDRRLGLPTALIPDTTDRRLPFYVNVAITDPRINIGLGFYRTNTTDIPVYLPGEMLLIKAECLAQTDVTAAIAELNKVIKKKAAEDVWGIGADIAAGYTGAATKEAVLTQIYRQRCIELFNSGLRLEDSRRLGRPGPDQPANVRERGRNFLPYPQTERDNNTATPADPAI